MGKETKTVMVTGANAGLGLETMRLLVKRDPTTHVVLTARTQAKAEAALATVVRETGVSADRMSTLLFDLTDPASVDAALEEVSVKGLVFDGVVLNAGGMSPPPNPQRLDHPVRHERGGGTRAWSTGSWGGGRSVKAPAWSSRAARPPAASP